MNFRRSVIIAELWQPKVARCLKKLRNFCVFWKNDPLRLNFQNSVSNVFIATPIDVLCSNFVKYGRRKSVKSCVAYLTKKNKISPGSPAVATARIAPKICHDQPQTMWVLQISSKSVHFRRIITERLNTTKTRRKLNLIFGWSLAFVQLALYFA